MSAGGRFPYPETDDGESVAERSAPVVGEALKHRGSVDRLRAARDEGPGVRHFVVTGCASWSFGRELPRHAATEPGDEVVAAMAAAAATAACRIGELP